jgi:hypothetical protein
LRTIIDCGLTYATLDTNVVAHNVRSSLDSKEHHMDTLRLNGNRQLFIDNGHIDEVDGLAKVLNQPTPYACNPILRPSPY